MPQIKGIHVSGYTVGTSIIVNQGSILAFGTLWEDGSLVLCTAYPELFAEIGYAHGSDSTGTYFRLPDSRGKVKRGQDESSGNDPDAASRTAADSNGRGATGDAVGSIQAGEYQSHAHSVYDPGHVHGISASQAAGGSSVGALVGGSNVNTNSAGTNIGIYPNGGNETRMINLYCRYAIAYI